MSNKNKDEYNAYMREYMLKRYYKRRLMAIEHLGGICALCGSDDRLEVDHIDPENKSIDLGKAFTSMSEARLLEELQVCQVLCYECHKRKTRKDLATKFNQREHWEHGTISGYRYCKCDDCKRAKREWTAEYRKTHPRGKAV